MGRIKVANAETVVEVTRSLNKFQELAERMTHDILRDEGCMRAYREREQRRRRVMCTPLYWLLGFHKIPRIDFPAYSSPPPPPEEDNPSIKM